MANTVAIPECQPSAGHDELKVEVGASLIEASGGAEAIVLSILGLLHISVTVMASIATIVAGASLLVASTLAASVSKLLPRCGVQRVHPS